MQPSDPSQPLRQGDICAITHIPIWYFKQTSVQVSPDPKSPDSIVIPTWGRADKHDGRSLVVVASQCCDLENPKKGNRIGVLVAPLMRVPASPGDWRYDEIMSSHELDADLQAYRWIQLFPFKLPEDGDFAARDVVADSSALTTMAPAADAVDHLLENRLFTLDDPDRAAFRVKLAAMVGRDPDREWNAQGQ